MKKYKLKLIYKKKVSIFQMCVCVSLFGQEEGLRVRQARIELFSKSNNIIKHINSCVKQGITHLLQATTYYLGYN